YQFVATIIMIIVVAGAIVMWARSNNITSVTDGYNYFKTVADRYKECNPILENNCDWGLSGQKPDQPEGETNNPEKPDSKNDRNSSNNKVSDYDLSNDAEAFGNGQLEDYHKALEEIPVAELDT